MSPPLGGLVATSTVNNPVSSRSFFSTGVVACHLWLFCPSMTRALRGPAALIGVSNTAKATATRQTSLMASLQSPPSYKPRFPISQFLHFSIPQFVYNVGSVEGGAYDDIP